VIFASIKNVDPNLVYIFQELFGGTITIIPASEKMERGKLVKRQQAYDYRLSTIEAAKLSIPMLFPLSISNQPKLAPLLDYIAKYG